MKHNESDYTSFKKLASLYDKKTKRFLFRLFGHVYQIFIDWREHDGFQIHFNRWTKEWFDAYLKKQRETHKNYK